MNKPTIKGVRIKERITVKGLRALNDQLGPCRGLTDQPKVITAASLSQNGCAGEHPSTTGVPQPERNNASVGTSFAEQLRAAEGEIHGEWSHPKVP